MSDRDQRLERLYAEAERKNETRKAATVRRGPTSLIAVCLGLTLAVGVVAAVDLRRLQTPQGTALAWTGAAVFGECTTFRQLSVDRRDQADADDDARCVALRRATSSARERPADVELEVLEVREQSEEATALVRVRRPGGRAREVELTLTPKRSGWAVVLDEATCGALPCL